MKNISRTMLFCVVLFAAAFSALGQTKSEMAFTVYLEQPNRHYYHIDFRCEGIKDDTVDFKMPVWTPGYYRIMDFSKNVTRFSAKDGKGNPLEWEKRAKNIWQVSSGGAENIIVSYDVYAFGRSVADSFLDENKGYISPAGMFMHVGGRIGHPVTVTIKPYEKFGRMSTGLDAVEGKPNTFFAADFDVLYDCPIFIGNQEVVSFEVRGIPHKIAVNEAGDFDREKLVSVLKRMVEASVAIIGDIPYKHYTFIMMGEGRGGLEHTNSMAVFTKVAELDDPNDYKGWLSFLAHEYFHLYNVKCIRPIALGPFDYDKENYTNMLWFSEGVTVYYEYIILNRAGFMSREEVFEKFGGIIRSYESVPGHLFQSAMEASYNAWIQSFFGRGGNAAETTVSYYDKGAALGMLLDLKIRYETKNKRSLDDVMLTLYRVYYKEKKRGFTDEEFRKVCESTAGCSLQEIFDYASTVKEIDYPKYLAYAGLEIEMPKELPEAYLGAEIRERDGIWVISDVEWDSPASRAGLSIEDEIIAMDGIRINSEKMSEIIESKEPGEKVRIIISEGDMIRELEVVLGKRTEYSFKIKPLTNPEPLQSEILNDWLRE